MKKIVSVLTFSMACFALSAPAFADVKIEVREGAQIIQSQQFKEANPWLDLSDNQIATITVDNEVLTVRGPFHGRLKQARKSGGARQGYSGQVQDIKLQAQKKVKSGSTLPEGLNLNDISVEASDKQCVVGKPDRLWRMEAQKEAEIVVSVVGGPAAKMEFKKSNNFAKWPDGLGSINEDSDYIISYLDPQGVTRKFSLVVLDLKSPVELTIGKLVEKGCTFQAKIAAELDLRAKGQ
jgi:hypothetical protein